MTGGGEYSVEVTNLIPDMTYYYRMTDTGDIKSFVAKGIELNDEDTSDDPIQPVGAAFEIQNAQISGGSVTANVVNVSGETLSGTVIMAAYNSAGVCVSMRNIPVNGAAPGASIPVTFTAPADADHYKLMIWNSLTAMTPMAEPKEI